MNFIRSLDNASKIIKQINSIKISASLSYLPVVTKDPQEVKKNIEIYSAMLDRIKNENLDSDITLKLHQFGVYKHLSLAAESIEAVARHAASLGNFVWIDMERKVTVEATIEIFENIWDKYHNVGICLQAYLERTEADMKYLLAKRVPMRLVKGFYKPSDFKDWSRVTENYSHLIEILLKHSDRPCIATHDLALIEKAKRIIREQNLTNAEIQFFRGVRDKLAKQLVDEGFKVRLYVPYGNLMRFLLKGLPTFDNFHHLQRLLGFKKLV